MTVGYGYQQAHNGEIIQGVYEYEHKRLIRGLVTLPCSIYASKATFKPDDTGEVVVYPKGKKKAKRAAELALAACGHPEAGGLLFIESNIRTTLGQGSSTADTSSTIAAVADALSKTLTPETIGRLSVEAEKASDPIMFGDQVLFYGHRTGIVIEDFGGGFPAMRVLGFNTDHTGRGVDTDTHPRARYTSCEIQAFRPLLGLTKYAVRQQDPRLLGRVATASACINCRQLPMPLRQYVPTLIEVAVYVSALGLQVSHSGTCGGLLFDPAVSTTQDNLQRAEALLGDLGISDTWTFLVGDN